MKKINYKGKEIVLDGELEKGFEKTELERKALKIISYVTIGGWLVSCYGINGLNEMRNAKADLLANHPTEYREFLDAEKSLHTFRQSFMITSNGGHYHRHDSLDSFIAPEDTMKLSKNLSSDTYNSLIKLAGGDREVHAGLEKIRLDLEKDYNHKKEPLKEKVDRTSSLGLLEFISLLIGASVTLWGAAFGGAIFHSYRGVLRRMKDLDQEVKIKHPS